MNDFLLLKQATESLISEQIVAGLTAESQWWVAALNLLNFPNSMALSIRSITRTRGKGVSHRGTKCYVIPKIEQKISFAN